MWVFLNDSFLSIVQHRKLKRAVMIRARLAGDLERVFPTLADRVEKTPNADYLYRLVVPKSMLQKAMAAQLERIDYPNFKGSVAERFRHDVYMDVWSVMWRAQQRAAQAQIPFEESGWPETEDAAPAWR